MLKELCFGITFFQWAIFSLRFGTLSYEELLLADFVYVTIEGSIS